MFLSLLGVRSPYSARPSPNHALPCFHRLLVLRHVRTRHRLVCSRLLWLALLYRISKSVCRKNSTQPHTLKVFYPSQTAATIQFHRRKTGKALMC